MKDKLTEENIIFLLVWIYGQAYVAFSDKPLIGIGIILLAGFLYLKD